MQSIIVMSSKLFSKNNCTKLISHTNLSNDVNTSTIILLVVGFLTIDANRLEHVAKLGKHDVQFLA